jgi:hypothetical protein
MKPNASAFSLLSVNTPSTTDDRPAAAIRADSSCVVRRPHPVQLAHQTAKRILAPTVGVGRRVARFWVAPSENIHIERDEGPDLPADREPRQPRSGGGA